VRRGYPAAAAGAGEVLEPNKGKNLPMAEVVTPKIEGTPGKLVRRVFEALVVIVALAAVLGFLVLFLTLASWKAAVAAEILAVGAAGLAWKRRMFATWLRNVVIVTTLVVTVVLAVFMRSTWTVQAQHDARLSEMVSDLCTIDVSAGSVQGCSGSISNTGNGNSCRYLATASIPDVSNAGVITSQLESEGFVPTELDVWGDPIEDGRAYLVEGEDVRLFLQSSWQDEEGDLRCN
jgi:hypothetical protein